MGSLNFDVKHSVVPELLVKHIPSEVQRQDGFAPICRSGYQEIGCQAMLLIHWYWWYCSAKKPKKRNSNILITTHHPHHQQQHHQQNHQKKIDINIVVTGDQLFYLFWGIYVWNLLVVYCAPTRWLWTGAFARAQCPFLARERWSRLGHGEIPGPVWTVQWVCLNMFENRPPQNQMVYHGLSVYHMFPYN